ncbi:MAG: hypothetical protein AAGI15_15760 [Pseudomonadota bacterium]
MSPVQTWLITALSVGLMLGWLLASPLYGLAAGAVVGALLRWLLPRDSEGEE